MKWKPILICKKETLKECFSGPQFSWGWPSLYRTTRVTIIQVLSRMTRLGIVRESWKWFLYVHFDFWLLISAHWFLVDQILLKTLIILFCSNYHFLYQFQYQLPDVTLLMKRRRVQPLSQASLMTCWQNSVNLTRTVDVENRTTSSCVNPNVKTRVLKVNLFSCMLLIVVFLITDYEFIS